VTAVYAIVTADFGYPPEIGHDKTKSPVTLLRNGRSHSTEMSGHDGPKYAPAGLASLMGGLAQEYLATVVQMNETPNEALLVPVVEVFKQLQANEETQG